MGILRFLLAISVIFTHTRGTFGYVIAGGETAVQTFFMISGYLIALVLDTRYKEQSELFYFYGNRFLKLFPTYWLTLLLTVALGYVAKDANIGYFSDISNIKTLLSIQDTIYVVFANVCILGQDLLLFLSAKSGGLTFNASGIDGYTFRLAAIPQAWSLSLEIVFYLFAPFLLKCRTAGLMLLIAISTTLRILAAYRGFHDDPWSYRFFPFEIALFLAGAVAYRLQGVGRTYTDRELLLFTLLIAAFTILLQPLMSVTKSMGFVPEGIKLAYLVGVFAALPRLASASRRFVADRALGDLSYPMYITHWLIMTAVVYLGAPAKTLLSAIATLAVTIAVSQVIAIYYEPLFYHRKRFKSGGTLDRDTVKLEK